MRTLEILSRLQRNDCRAISDAEERDFGPVEVFLDHDASIAPAREAYSRMRERFVAIIGDDNALACCESIVLDYMRCTELIER